MRSVVGEMCTYMRCIRDPSIYMKVSIRVQIHPGKTLLFKLHILDRVTAASLFEAERSIYHSTSIVTQSILVVVCTL